MNRLGDYYTQMAALQRARHQLFAAESQNLVQQMSNGAGRDQIVKREPTEVKLQPPPQQQHQKHQSCSSRIGHLGIHPGFISDEATPSTLSTTSNLSPSSSLLLVSHSEPGDLPRQPQVFICTIEASLRHGQQIHLVTSDGQILMSTLTQLTIPYDEFRQNSAENTPSNDGKQSDKAPDVQYTGCTESDSINNDEKTCEDLLREQQLYQAQFPKGRINSNGEFPNDLNHTVEGINLEEIKKFARSFKMKRLSLGLTQTQVGQALSMTEGPAYSQSAICRLRFEKLDITPKSAHKIMPVLVKWMDEIDEKINFELPLPPPFPPSHPPPPPTFSFLPSALNAAAFAAASLHDSQTTLRPVTNRPISYNNDELLNGIDNGSQMSGLELSRKRKRRTSFTPQALEMLNRFFERNTHPTG